MIHSARFFAFKGIALQELDFEPLTVIVGANATGKTSILEALYLTIEACADRGPDSFLGNWSLENISSRRHSDDTKVQCETDSGSFGFEAYSYDIDAQTGEATESQDSNETTGWGWQPFPEEREARREMAGSCWPAKVLKLDPYALGAPSYFNTDKPEIDETGYGLASVLASIKLADDERYDRIIMDLRKFVPTIEKVRIEKTPITREEIEVVEVRGDSFSRPVKRTYSGEALVFDFVGAKRVPASGISNGTLTLLGLLTILHSPNPVKTILIDDFGDGLHPQAQRQLVELLKAFVKQEDLQIIATTHSPFVLDVLDGHQVRLATVNEKGESVFGSMTDHPEFDRWKNEMTPGDYWTMIGEKWVAGGPNATNGSNDIGVELER